MRTILLGYFIRIAVVTSVVVFAVPLSPAMAADDLYLAVAPDNSLPGSTLVQKVDVKFRAYVGPGWGYGPYGYGPYSGYYGPYYGGDGYGYYTEGDKTCVWNGYEYTCYNTRDRSRYRY